MNITISGHTYTHTYTQTEVKKSPEPSTGNILPNMPDILFLLDLWCKIERNHDYLFHSVNMYIKNEDKWNIIYSEQTRENSTQ